jgi:hypothetical protein
MWPLGAASGGPAAIPAGDRWIPAGGGWGRGLRVTSGRFGDSVGARSSRQGGHAGGQGGAAAAAAGFRRGRLGEGYGRLGWLVYMQRKVLGVPTGEGSRRRSGAPWRPVAALGGPAHREVAVRGHGRRTYICNADAQAWDQWTDGGGGLGRRATGRRRLARRSEAGTASAGQGATRGGARRSRRLGAGATLGRREGGPREGVSRHGRRDGGGRARGGAGAR